MVFRINLCEKVVPTGDVTTAKFLASFSPLLAVVKTFDIIWQSWFPVKISCVIEDFTWCDPYQWLYHEIWGFLVSNVFVVSILASKRLSTFLSRASLLSGLWAYCTLFLIKSNLLPFGSFSMIGGIQFGFNSFFDCIGFWFMCCCLWDIWKTRNQIVYDDHAGSFSRFNILRRASFLARSIKIPILADSCFKYLQSSPC